MLDGRGAVAERATHLAGGLARLGESLRVDEVTHRLSLREIEPAGEKCALRKFAGLSETRAQFKRAAQQQLQHHRRTVGRNFDQIFGSIRARSGEKCDQGFVNARGVVTGGVEHIGKTRMGVLEYLERMPQPDQLHRYRCSLRTAETHDADATASRRRGDGGDGLGNRFRRGHFYPSV